MHPKPNCIAAILISKLLLYSPFVFAAMGKPMKAMKKAMKSTSAKGKQTSGKGNQTPAKGKNTSAKGKPASAKVKPLKKRCSPERNLEETQLAKVGAAVPPGQNQTNRRNQ